MNNPGIFFGANLVLKPIAMTLMAVVLILSTAGNNAYAGVISQVPLFVSLEGVNPNIMFILDDSGSMHWEVLPDNEISNSIYYMFPTNQGYYGGSWYSDGATSRQGGFEDNNVENFRRRSSRNNASYYNPQITYSPWVKANGDPFDDADPACAYHNPVNTAIGCRNFTVQNTGNENTSTDSYGKWRRRKNDGTYEWWTGNYVNPQTGVAGFWPATYFNWTPGGAGCALPGNISTRACYTKVEIRSGNTYQGGAGRSDCHAAPTCTYDEEIKNFANWYTYYRSRILSARSGIGKAFVDQKDGLRVGFGAINKGSTAIDGVNTRAVISGVRSFNTENRQTFFDQLYNHIIPASGTPLRQALDAAGQYFSRTDNRGPWCDVPGAVSSTSYSCRRSYTILMTDGYWNGAEAGTAAARDNNDGTAGPTITGPDEQSFEYLAVSPFTDGNSNTLADIAMYYWKRDLYPTLENRVPGKPDDLNPAFWQHMVTFGVGLGVSGTITSTAAFAAIGDSNVTINWPAPSTTGTTANIDDLLHASVNSRGGFFSAADPDTFSTELSSMLQDIVSREESSAAALATNSTKFDTGTTSYRAKFNSTNWSGQLIAYQFNANGTLGAERWNTDTAGKIPAHGSRKIFTMVGNAGQAFSWDNLDAGQKTALKTLNAVVASDAVAQQRLHWIRGDQSNEKPGGTLRQRTRLLGDIVNSDPFYVSGSPSMLYVGANDGMLHAFNAETGVEQFAYIPKAVFPNLSSLPDPGYNHKYFVDGSPIVTKLDNGDLMLVGMTGAGGRSVFALDVTNPTGFGAGDVLWEVTNADLGYTIGQPSIGRLQNGAWVAVFGNGYNSDSGKAFLFVVNLTSGALIAKIPTNNDTSNGLAKPTLLPDSDGRIAAAYAGDLQGNLWKFDLTNNTVAFGGAALFTAKNASGVAQPITSAPTIGRHPNGGYLIFFGTGKYFEVGDHTAINVPIQSFYGIWDTATMNNGAWEGGTAIAATDRSVLQQQEIENESTAVENKWRIVSDNSITWEGANAKRGWYMDLVFDDNDPQTNDAVGERVTDSAILNLGRVIFTTRIPFNTEDPCIPSVGTSWVMVVDMLTGGRSSAPVFDVNRDSQFDEFDSILVNGERVAVSGFEAIAAGMARATLIQFSEGAIDVLLSGTSDLTTTASATNESGGSDAQTAIAVAQAAREAAEEAVAAAQAAASQAAAEAEAAQAAAAAAAAAAAVDGADAETIAAAEEAAAAAAVAETAAAAAATAAEAAATSEATVEATRNAATAAALANPSDAATAVLDAIIGALNAGLSPIEAITRSLETAGALQGLGSVGVRVAGQTASDPPQKTWRQLR